MRALAVIIAIIALIAGLWAGANAALDSANEWCLAHPPKQEWIKYSKNR